MFATVSVAWIERHGNIIVEAELEGLSAAFGDVEVNLNMNQDQGKLGSWWFDEKTVVLRTVARTSTPAICNIQLNVQTQKLNTLQRSTTEHATETEIPVCPSGICNPYVSHRVNEVAEIELLWFLMYST